MLSLFVNLNKTILPHEASLQISSLFVVAITKVSPSAIFSACNNSEQNS